MRKLKESITDDERNNCCWRRPIKDYPIPGEVQNYCWWTRLWMNSCHMMRETAKQLLMDETNEEQPIPVDVKTTVDGRGRRRNLYQMMYETTTDGSDQRRTTHTRWCTKQLLIDETDKRIHTRWCTKKTVDAWDQWRTTNTRWCTKQFLKDEANEEISIPDCVQNGCWWTKQIKKPTPDDVRNICWGM